MRSLLSVTSAPLIWHQPKLMEPAFDLKYSEEVLASLKFKNSFGSLAIGKVAEGEWSFKRQGFLKTYVTVRASGKEDNVAVFHNNTWSEGGTLEFANGKKFQANSNFWHSKFEFTDEDGNPIIRFTNIGGFKLHAEMEILAPARSLPEMPWMVLLGWYLTVMNSRDGEMVAALF